MQSRQLKVIKKYLGIQKSLGEIYAQGEPIPIKMEKTGDDAFEINYKLDVPMREDIYEYIVSEA